MTLFHCHLCHFNWFILKWQSQCKMVEGKGCDGMFPSWLEILEIFLDITEDDMMWCEAVRRIVIHHWIILPGQYCNIRASLSYRYNHYHSLIVLLSPVRHINIVLTVLDMFECNKQSSIPLIILYSRILTSQPAGNISTLEIFPHFLPSLPSLLCFRVCLISLKFSPRPRAIICRIK